MWKNQLDVSVRWRFTGQIGAQERAELQTGCRSREQVDGRGNQAVGQVLSAGTYHLSAHGRVCLSPGKWVET